jgi:hypothetical protein
VGGGKPPRLLENTQNLKRRKYTTYYKIKLLIKLLFYREYLRRSVLKQLKCKFVRKFTGSSLPFGGGGETLAMPMIVGLKNF